MNAARNTRAAARRMLSSLIALMLMLSAAALAFATPAVTAPDIDGAPGDSAPADAALAELMGLSEEERELLKELDPDEVVHVEDGDLSINAELGEGWRNILLLGNDSRSLDDNGRTDTMIIASINQQTGEIKLTSIMRDTLVSIPGKSQKSKINAAYRFGGPNLAMKTVNEAFGMNISEYVTVNLSGFADIIDSIGGIELDISEAEMRHVNNIMGYYYRDAQKSGLAEGRDFSELDQYGKATHMTGQQALAYSRIRKLDTDYRRTERQRNVLMAIARKLAGQSAAGLAASALRMWGNVRTNLSFFDAVQLGLKGASAVSAGVEQLRLPADGTFKTGTYDGRWEIHANLDENARLLHEFIYD